MHEIVSKQSVRQILFHSRLEISVYSVYQSGEHLLLISGGLHERILFLVGHVAELYERCGDLAPVVAHHGVGLHDSFVVAAGRLHILGQHDVGELTGLLVCSRSEGIVFRDANGHGAVLGVILGSRVGVDSEEDRRVVLIGDLRAVDAAVGAAVLRADHDDLVAALCEQIPEL